MKNNTTRRQAIKNMALGVAGAATLPTMAAKSCSPSTVHRPPSASFRHSVCRWCYDSIPLEAFCEKMKPIGIGSVELTTPEEWPVLQRYGLTAAVGTMNRKNLLTEGWNQPALHKELTADYLDLVGKAAKNGIPNVILFSGNRREGLTDEQGIEHCAQGLQAVVKFAEKQGVTIIMELLNSKVDHHGYQCDRTPWGVKLAEKLGSPNFKLLYDIYHMQIMEGDVIATIRQNKQYIGHFHTGGVPGRNEIDDTQELYYPAIMRAISETGFKGHVAQEFIPKSKDALASLKRGVEICSV